MYLKGKSDRERGKDRNINSICQMVLTAELGEFQISSQELSPDLHMDDRNGITQASSITFPGTSARNWIRNRHQELNWCSNMGSKVSLTVA